MGILNKLKIKKNIDNNPRIEKVSVNKQLFTDANTLNSSNANIYQPISISLRYVAIEKRSNNSGNNTVDTKIYKTQNFVIPKGMTLDDACIVLSYLTEKFEEEYHYQPSSQESVARLAYNLPKYGFLRECDVKQDSSSSSKSKNKKNSTTSINLYTVGGDVNLFKKTDMYNEYFDWFTPSVKQETVNAIYTKIGKALPTDQAEPTC